jgi:hypothetical protein
MVSTDAVTYRCLARRSWLFLAVSMFLCRGTPTLVYFLFSLIKEEIR